MAGVNDMILCRSTAVVPNEKTKYLAAVIYQGTDGSTEISHTTDFDISALERIITREMKRRDSDDLDFAKRINK